MAGPKREDGIQRNRSAKGTGSAFQQKKGKKAKNSKDACSRFWAEIKNGIGNVLAAEWGGRVLTPRWGGEEEGGACQKLGGTC